MKAIQYMGRNSVVIGDVPKPELSPGHVLIRVTAAGVCRTDVHVRAAAEQIVPVGLVLGHEIAGDVAEWSPEVEGFNVGDQVIVHPVWSCGTCRMCKSGIQNACRNTGNRMAPAPTPGVSVDGGMAEYILAPAAALVAAPGLEAAFAASLTDAGIVPFHSINAVKELLRPGSSAVVIGIGGLGQFAVQMLRELSTAKIVAVDVRTSALDSVRDRVDFAFEGKSPDIVDQILNAVGEYGADFVLDLVGDSESMALAGHVVAPYGAIRVPGLSDGVFGFDTSMTQTSLPWGASIVRPYSGTYRELYELVALAQTGRLHANVIPYPFERAIDAFDDLEAGKINGRAVIMMDS